MKVVVLFFLLVSIVCGSMQVQAAGPSYTAKYNTPSIDGVVNSNEYGAKVPFNSSNLSLFYYNRSNEDPTTGNANFPDVTYSFAWDEGYLYIGITAQNITNISDTQFQIDLSPNKKIKDGKAGIFYTFKCITVGTDGLMGISRANFQAASIARNCKSASREVSSGVYNLEIAIPLSELQVTGNGGNFTDLKLKSGEWGIGCYLVGNDGGYTNTLGAGNNDAIGYNWETGVGSLVQYYNTFTLATKPSTTTPDEGTNGNVAQNPNNSTKPDNSTTQKDNQTNNETNNPTGEVKGPINEQPGVGTNGSTEVNGENSVNNNADTEKNDNTVDSNKEKTNKTEKKSSDNNQQILLVTCVIAGVMVLLACIAAFFILRKKPTTTTNANENRRDSDEKK